MMKSDEDKIFRKLKPKEMVWVLLLVILIILLSLKSVYFDPYKPDSMEDERNFERAMAFTDEQYDGLLYKYHLMDIRIIKLRSEEGSIRVQTRKYVLGFFPFGDQYFILND